MKKIFIIFALTTSTVSAFVQNAADSISAETGRVTMTRELYPGQRDDDLYHGLTRKFTFDRVVSSYGLEVTYDKTTHIIFPSAVRYMDLGSPNLVVGRIDGAENVIRVKAVVGNFRDETSASVITEGGNSYTFNVRCVNELLLLSIKMKDFIHNGSKVSRPNDAFDIYLKEPSSGSPKLVQLTDKSIHKENKRHVEHIGSKALSIQYLLHGIYTHNGLLCFHTQVHNQPNIPLEVDFVTFRIMGKRTMRHTAIQEQIVFPLRVYDYATLVTGNKDGRTIFIFDRLTIPVGKVPIAELNEKSGGRHQLFTVESEDIVRTKVINKLEVKQPCVRSSIC